MTEQSGGQLLFTISSLLPEAVSLPYAGKRHPLL